MHPKRDQPAAPRSPRTRSLVSVRCRYASDRKRSEAAAQMWTYDRREWRFMADGCLWELAQLSLFAVPALAMSLIFKDVDLKGLHYRA